MKRSNLRRVSDKQKARTAALAELREHLIYSRGCACQRCGDTAKDLDLHHLLGRGRGGKDTPDNLVLLCRWCHTSITDHTVSDWPEWTRATRVDSP